MNDEATAPDLPRVRVHDDGAVALHYPSAGAPADWMVVPPEAVLMHWIDKDVSDPGWRDAVIVPLPEPDEIHERAGTGWRAIEIVVWASQTTIFDGTHLLGASGARKLAAALLAAAAHVDQAEAVSGGQ